MRFGREVRILRAAAFVLRPGAFGLFGAIPSPLYDLVGAQGFCVDIKYVCKL